jgi:integrase
MVAGAGLHTISVMDIDKLKSELLSETSPGATRTVLGIVGGMFEKACQWQYIQDNPVKKVSKPRVPKNDDHRPLSGHEVRSFLDSAEDHKWATLFRVAITTGLRIGELLVMRWCNIDWEAKKYSVRENLNYSTKEKSIGEPKTESSKATVDLYPATLRALSKLRAEQAEEKLQTIDYKDDGFIFARSNGRHYFPASVRRMLERILKQAGLPRIKIHDLRHTCASTLIGQGLNAKYIQHQMRHASIKMTFDTYGHLFPNASEEAGLLMDAALS